MKNLTIIVFLLAFAGCIKNDLPYPRIQQNITSLRAVGESKTALIDSAECSATVYLDEVTDIQSVSFSEFAVSPGGTADPDLSQGVYNLSSPIVVSITRFQTYQWLVKAVQEIERYFTIEGQIGASVIDAVGRRIIVEVPESFNLKNLNVTSVKLGPVGITSMAPDIRPGVFDFSQPVRVMVTAHGRSEEWTIYVEKIETLVNTTAVDPWSCVIWAYGNCPSDMTGAFQYKKSGDSAWIDVPQNLVTQSQGTFSCYIPHLEPLTEYTVRAVSGENIGNEITVTTYSTADIPDGDFEQWWLKNDKIWCPWNENGEQYWDTGNTGAATLGQSNVMPTDHTPSGSGRAAELDTRFVGIATIGKLATGSIYTGSFAKVDGTNGILDFGRPFTLRPTKLCGYFQYQGVDISHSNREEPYVSMIGQPDTCHIYVALTDWTAPYQIRTNPNNRQLFNKDADYIIGYGDLQFSGKMDDYQPFEIEIKYRSTSRVPSYVQITAAASKYGDFFTGGNGSVLYVDQFSFDYDY